MIVVNDDGETTEAKPKASVALRHVCEATGMLLGFYGRKKEASAEVTLI